MSCYHSCILRSPIEDVWNTINDFHDLSWAGFIETQEKVGDKSGSEVGAGRILNGVIHETLLEVDDEDFLIIYSIDDGPDALSKDKVEGYRGMIQLSPITLDGGTFMEWSSSWRNDGDGVEEFCNPIYRSAMKSLQDKLG